MTVKLHHFYEFAPLYNTLSKRNFPNFTKEAHDIAELARTWYYHNCEKQTVTALELFAGHKSLYKELFKQFFPFPIESYAALDLIEHPDSEANGVTVGNALTYDFGRTFDLILQPWDNLPCLMNDKSKVPTLSAVNDLFCNMKRHMHRSSAFLMKLACSLDEFLETDAPLGKTNTQIIDLSPYHQLTQSLNLGDSPAHLVYDYHPWYDKKTKCHISTYDNIYVVTKNGKVNIEIEEPLTLRFFEHEEVTSEVGNAGLEYTAYCVDDYGLYIPDSLSDATHLIITL